MNNLAAANHAPSPSRALRHRSTRTRDLPLSLSLSLSFSLSLSVSVDGENWIVAENILLSFSFLSLVRINSRERIGTKIARE
jgi:hypothetical protein